MNEKSIERYEIFKADIRNELHGSDEYMFSQKYMESNGNNLINMRKKTEFVMNSNSNIDLTSHDENSIKKM